MSNQTNTDPKLTEIIKHLDAILSIEIRKPGTADKLPAVIRIHELLEPAGGKQFPIFPPSYAGEGQNAPPVYDLNGLEYGETLEENEKSGRKRITRDIKRARHCTIDSPQSHANRTEVAFVEDEDLRKLVPQATATIPREREVEDRASENLLRLPHRVADFRVRVSNRKDDVAGAIKTFANGDALALLRMMPTSIVFGFWDSRAKGYQHKHARILLSRIDAFDVIPCERHAVYSGPYSKDEFAAEILQDKQLADALAKQDEATDAAGADTAKEGKKKQKEMADKMAKRGFTAAPASGLGGVIVDVDGTIERLSLISLTDIARIYCRKPAESEKETPKKQNAKAKESDAEPTAPSPAQLIDAELTNAARRYILALALLAEGFPRSTGSYRLRSGCELVAAQTAPTVELRGAGIESEAAKALKALCTDRELLIKVAANAKAALQIPNELPTFTVSREDLKKDLLEK